jgi:hypothetical protein
MKQQKKLLIAKSLVLLAIGLLPNGLSALEILYKIPFKKYPNITESQLSINGDLVFLNDYGGDKSNSLIKYRAHDTSEVVKLNVLPNEILDLIGFMPSGEIAVISQITKKKSSLVLIDPKTNDRKTLKLELNEFSSFNSVVTLINSSGLIALVSPTYQNSIYKVTVTFINSNLTKSSYTLDYAYGPYSKLAYLTSDNKVIISTDEGAYFSINTQGSGIALGDNLFGVPDSKIFHVLPGQNDVVAGVEALENSKQIYYHLLNLQDLSVQTIFATTDGNVLPSFENNVYYSNQSLDLDNSLLTTVSSVGYSGSYTLGDSQLKINSDGNIVHLNCFVNPQVGRIDRIMRTHSNGVIAMMKSPDGKYNLAVIDSLTTSGNTNYCVQVQTTTTKACKGYISTYPNVNVGYGYAASLKSTPDNCKLTLNFKDANGHAIQGKTVRLRRNGSRKIKTYVMDDTGSTTIPLKSALNDIRACGWTILLEDLNYQPNGFIIFSERTYSCRRI